MNTPTSSGAVLDMKRWQDFSKTPHLHIIRRRLIHSGAKIFTMGSCFAMEIRRAMERKGYDVYPRYRDVQFSPVRQIFDKIPEREFISHYDTFVIRQEFEAALGVWTDRESMFCDVRNAIVNQVTGREIVRQDPSRKQVFAKDHVWLKDLTDKIDAVIHEGIVASDLIVITLGLTEVWRHNVTGRHLCRPPNTGLAFGGGEGQATFRQSTFVENYLNVKATLDLLFSKYPDKNVVLTVSPVPLAMTYAKTDIGTANMESKSILRAVAGQICREYAERVAYFPSYEMATIMPGPVFQEDKRHVLPEFADRVVSTFNGAFS